MHTTLWTIAASLPGLWRCWKLSKCQAPGARQTEQGDRRRCFQTFTCFVSLQLILSRPSVISLMGSGSKGLDGCVRKCVWNGGSLACVCEDIFRGVGRAKQGCAKTRETYKGRDLSYKWCLRDKLRWVILHWPAAMCNQHTCNSPAQKIFLWSFC